MDAIVSPLRSPLEAGTSLFACLKREEPLLGGADSNSLYSNYSQAATSKQLTHFIYFRKRRALACRACSYPHSRGTGRADARRRRWREAENDRQGGQGAECGLSSCIVHGTLAPGIIRFLNPKPLPPDAEICENHHGRLAIGLSRPRKREDRCHVDTVPPRQQCL